MGYGIKTWDASGVDNNTGIVKIFLVGQYAVAANQQTGSASFSVPNRAYLDFFFQPSAATVGSTRRRVSISGSTLTLSAVSDDDFSAGTYNAMSGNFLIYARGLQ